MPDATRVLEIQAKLHRWARDDPHRRFDDLFNLVADPAFLLVAWDRVQGNKGARTAGVDGRTAASVSLGTGVEEFLDRLRTSLRDRSFTPMPVGERMIPKPGGKLQLPVYAYNGDSSWLGWNLISGRWYHGRGEVDASSVLLAATGRAVGDRITLTVNGKPVTVRIAGEVFDPSGLPTLFTSWQTLGGAAAGHYDIALKPGTSTQAYSGAMDQALGHGYVVFSPAGPSVAAQVDTTWFRLLALLVAVLAALGVLNSVLMATRERVHDLGVFKAVGLTPRQAIAMVACWAVAPAVIAAVIALPAGLILQDAIVRQLAASSSTTTGFGGIVLPGSFVHVLGIADLLLLALAGLGIAAVGALGPASWAAAAKTATALRTE